MLGTASRVAASALLLCAVACAHKAPPPAQTEPPWQTSSPAGCLWSGASSSRPHQPVSTIRTPAALPLVVATEVGGDVWVIGQDGRLVRWAHRAGPAGCGYDSALLGPRGSVITLRTDDRFVYVDEWTRPEVSRSLLKLPWNQGPSASDYRSGYEPALAVSSAGIFLIRTDSTFTTPLSTPCSPVPCDEDVTWRLEFRRWESLNVPQPFGPVLASQTIGRAKRRTSLELHENEAHDWAAVTVEELGDPGGVRGVDYFFVDLHKLAATLFYRDQRSDLVSLETGPHVILTNAAPNSSGTTLVGMETCPAAMGPSGSVCVVSRDSSRTDRLLYSSRGNRVLQWHESSSDLEADCVFGPHEAPPCEGRLIQGGSIIPTGLSSPVGVSFDWIAGS
jgi:hypothetical protein